MGPHNNHDRDRPGPEGDHGQGEHGHQVGAQGAQLSYSDRLKTNVKYDQKLKRNVLEITLEKTDTETQIEDVGEEDIARVFKSLGIDIVSQVQGSQLHYKGKFSIISVWMAPGLSLDKFCKDVNIRK